MCSNSILQNIEHIDHRSTYIQPVGGLQEECHIGQGRTPGTLEIADLVRHGRHRCMYTQKHVVQYVEKKR